MKTRLARRQKKVNSLFARVKPARQAEPASEAPFFEIDDAVRLFRPAPGEEVPAPAAKRTAAHGDAPLPYASFVQEILEEYRSDSSPTHYAMAVELDDVDAEEEALFGPPEKTDDPFLDNPPLLHSFLNDAEDRDLPPEPQPPAVALPAGDGKAPSPDSWDWMDIVKEFQTEKTSGETPARSRNAGMEGRPMTVQEQPPVQEAVLEIQPDIFDLPPMQEAPAPVDPEEDALPAGIRVLTEQRLESEPEPAGGHLSVEDILAEYGVPDPGSAPPSPARPSGENAPAEKASGASKGRKSRLEAEARSLFAETASPRKKASATQKAAASPVPEETEAVPAPLPTPETVPELDISVSPVFEGEGAAEPADAPVDAEKAGKAAPSFKALRDKLPRRKKRAEAKKPASGESEAAEESVSGLHDRDLDAAYAPDDDYETEEAADPNDFPSFGQYLLGLVTGLWVRLHGIAPAATGTETMEAEEEDLGEELTPGAASRYYGSYVHSLRLRFRIALVLWVVLLYISLGLPVSGMLKSVRVASGMCLGLQLGIMLLSLDVVTGAALNLTRARFGADALAVLSCLLTSLDALVVLLSGFGSPHVPLCLISSFSLIGILYSSYLSARGLRKSLRVPAIGKRAYSVTAESNLTERSITLIKSLRPVTGFVRRSEEAAPDETAYNRAAPLLLALSVLMSLVVVLVKKSPSNFLYVLTAVLAPAIPVTALMNYAMPFFIGSQRIFTSGAAIAGWSGLCDVGSSHNLIVTDRDLFPENSVEIGTIRIFADVPSEKIVSYAGTMICASDSGLSGCFSDLMERNGCTMRRVEGFEYLSGGGLQGTIDGQTVLCGGMELMRLMNVRFPYRLVSKTSVLLAIDGVLCGIFNIKYEANPTVKKALVGLIRSNRHPVFAIRDFNVNPEMLHETFDVATDGYDFPPYMERFAISEARPAENRKIAAVLCREGLGSLVHMADTGRNMYLAIRINLMISLLSSVFGVFAVFFLLITTGTVGLPSLLLYTLIWIVPITLISLFLRF